MYPASSSSQGCRPGIVQVLQTRPGEVQMEQARAILVSGDLQHACDIAAEVLDMKASREVHFAAHALCGLLWHTLWAASLQSGAIGALLQGTPMTWTVGFACHSVTHSSLTWGTPGESFSTCTLL